MNDFYMKLAVLVENEMAEIKKDPERFGPALDALVTQASMMIVRVADGNPELINTLAEGSSFRLFQMAGLVQAGMPDKDTS